MLPGKGKHGMKRSGKGGSSGSAGKVGPSASVSGSASASGNKSQQAQESVLLPTPPTPPIKIKVEVDDYRETSPGLPIIRIADNQHLLPRYSAVLNRSKDETVGVEELDGLQLELESMLSTAALRHRALLELISQAVTWDERHKKSKSSSQKPSTPSSNSLLKRSAIRSDSRPPKKIKIEGIKLEQPSAAKLNKLRVLPGAHSPKPDTPEIQKHQLSDKFWASVDPYCRPISQDDINYLQDLIRTREEERSSELLTIPPLGKHYTLRWGDEDMLEQAKRPNHLSGAAGPMTQRLMSALLEDKSAELTVEDDGGRELSSSRSAAFNHVKSLAFETRVRNELREQGILDGDEAPKEQADDELLLEMKRCQSELKALASHNLQRLRHLLALAEVQMNRQELKNKLQSINSEIVKMQALKLEKKQLNKKEKETTWRLVKDLKGVLKELYPHLAVKN